METFENKNIKIWIENEIFYLVYKTTDITLPIAQMAFKARMDMCNNKTYPLLGDVRLVKNFNRDARKFFSSGKSQEFLSAGALLINNPVQKFIVNFWLQIDRPKVPAKFFTDEAEAIQWLENYKVS